MVDMLKTRRCLFCVRTFFGLTSKLWSLFLYILRKPLRTVSKPIFRLKNIESDSFSRLFNTTQDLEENVQKFKNGCEKFTRRFIYYKIAPTCRASFVNCNIPSAIKRVKAHLCADWLEPQVPPTLSVQLQLLLQLTGAETNHTRPLERLHRV